MLHFHHSLRVCLINSSRAHCIAKLVSHSLRLNCDSSSRSNASIVAAVTLCWATKSAEIDLPIDRPSVIALALDSMLLIFLVHLLSVVRHSWQCLARSSKGLHREAPQRLQRGPERLWQCLAGSRPLGALRGPQRPDTGLMRPPLHVYRWTK